MENATDFFSDVLAWVSGAVIFVMGLLADFKSYSSKKKVMVVAGGFLGIIVLLTLLQALFG